MVLFIKAILIYIAKPTVRESIRQDLQYLLDNANGVNYETILIKRNGEMVMADANGKEIRL